MKKIDWLVLIFICIVSAVTLKDLFKPGLYTSHDGIHQVVRFFYFDQVIRDGQIPPRWVGGLMNGFGYPLFIFSYHLPWVIAEVIHILGSSIIDSVKMTFLVGFAMSGITMYLFQKDIFGRLAAVAGTALYLFAPYRFSNIFVRSAIGDATTFIFAPLLFWAFSRLRSGWSWRWIVLGAVSIAGLILSHAMVAVLFLSSLMIYLIFSLAGVKDKLSYLKSFLCVALLGGGISAYYLIPSLTERNYTQFQSLMSQLFIGSFFPTINELIYSKWGYGVFHAQEGAMSLQLGLTGWLIVILTFLAVSFLPFLYKKITKKETQLFAYGRILLVIFVFTVFMMLSVSLPVWKIISPVVLVDFPWRYLAVSTFVVSLCTGLLVAMVKRFKLALVLLLVLSAIYFNRNHLRINETLGWDLPFMLKLEKTTNTFDEYKPKWADNGSLQKAKPAVEFSSPAQIDIRQQNSKSVSFNLQAPKEGTIRLNTIYYPGWKAWIDGQQVSINYNSGFIEFPVKAGSSKITANFEETPLRLFSDLITLISITAAVFFWITKKSMI